MASEPVEHAAGGDECNHVGASESGERTDPDSNAWAGATAVGARRSLGDVGRRRRGRQPQPRLHAAGADAHCSLHAPN